MDAARELAGDDPAAAAAVALAECSVPAGQAAAEGTLRYGEGEPAAVVRAQRAVALAGRAGDPVAESAALGELTGALWTGGEILAAAATARRRIGLLSSVPVTPASTYDRASALHMVTMTSVAAGDLPSARRWGRQLRDLPLLAEVRYSHVQYSNV